MVDYPVLAGCGLTRSDAAKVYPRFSAHAIEDVNGPLIYYKNSDVKSVENIDFIGAGIYK